MNVGIYGGTFNPIHNGHIRAALAFYEQVQLDKLLIVPTAIPPHKTFVEQETAQDRLTMVKLAFCDHPAYEKRIFVCDYEIQKKERSYTVHTLQHFKQFYTNLTFLCGTDMFLTLDQWYEATEIFHLCRIAFMRRESVQTEIEQQIEEKKALYQTAYGAKIVEINQTPYEISSTELRHALSMGTDVQAYVPAKVYAYLQEKKLYQR